MAQSGRWDIQEHAGVGHVNIRYDRAGHLGPAYAYERYLGNGRVESFQAFRRRVSDDVLWAKRTLSEQIPGYSPWSFAVRSEERRVGKGAGRCGQAGGQ